MGQRHFPCGPTSVSYTITTAVEIHDEAWHVLARCGVGLTSSDHRRQSRNFSRGGVSQTMGLHLSDMAHGHDGAGYEMAGVAAS